MTRIDQNGLPAKGFLKRRLGCDGLFSHIDKFLRALFCTCGGNFENNNSNFSVVLEIIKSLETDREGLFFSYFQSAQFFPFFLFSCQKCRKKACPSAPHYPIPQRLLMHNYSGVFSASLQVFLPLFLTM